MDFDDQDNEIAVELLNNQTDDELSLQDAERQTTAGGCFALALTLVIVVIAAAGGITPIIGMAGIHSYDLTGDCPPCSKNIIGCSLFSVCR